MNLWEILIPAYWNNGKKISVEHHRLWDKKVRNIAGGLTVLKTAKGQWLDPFGKLYKEKMIPVRIACNEGQMRKIIEVTFDHYPDQKAIMAYLISNTVIMEKR